MVVHKTTEFKRREFEGAFDALARIPDVELIQLQQQTPWRGVRGTANGKPDNWPVLRGTLVHLSGTDLLLWTQGNAPSVARRGNFYKEGRGIPHPVLLSRAAGHSRQGPRPDTAPAAEPGRRSVSVPPFHVAVSAMSGRTGR